MFKNGKISLFFNSPISMPIWTHATRIKPIQSLLKISLPFITALASATTTFYFFQTDSAQEM
jgi:hypothetical protein